MDGTRTVAVIGAGFSGVMTAVHLLRTPAPSGLRVVLVNRTGRMARGVAYGTRSPVHLLNVPAGRMSAFPDDPEHFLRFAQTKDPAVTATTFLPRSVYGEYLEAVLEEAERTTAGRLDRVVGELTAIDFSLSPARLTTTNGGAFSADRIVMALGNYPPKNPDVSDPNVLDSPSYVRDPWGPNALANINLDAPILLLGTGLTMMDVALDLHGRGAKGPVIAISRHGLLPQPHKAGVHADASHRPTGIESIAPTARNYVRAIRSRIRELSAQGICWRSVVDSLRPLTATLWQRLPMNERERFLRHVKPYWEVVRHRAAIGPACTLQERMDSRWLQVRAARLIDLSETKSGLVAKVRGRGTSHIEELVVGTAINCTGPSGDIRSTADPLMAFLRDRRLIGPDPLGLGIAIADNGAVLDQAGTASRILYYVGPLARAGYWERTAVPELRVLAQDIAKTVMDTLLPAEWQAAEIW
jgi:uncharacterized NAD(P)/FAD-binding protein YdhS